MSYVGGTFIFDFRRRFDDVGILNTNCAVEVDGQHYVFDNFDLYRHDGTSKASIAHDRVKDFVFGGLIKELRHLAFVAHNPKLNEVLFCYPANDRFTTAIPSRPDATERPSTTTATTPGPTTTSRTSPPTPWRPSQPA
jgi:hypothetical protein